jgi:hypothetical protein
LSPSDIFASLACKLLLQPDMTYFAVYGAQKYTILVPSADFTAAARGRDRSNRPTPTRYGPSFAWGPVWSKQRQVPAESQVNQLTCLDGLGD